VIAARPSPIAQAFFDRYVPRYLARRFARVWLWGDVDQLDVPRDRPLIFAMSHASWWDVLVAYWLARGVLRIESYGAMDEAQLARYRILARLGVFSVDRHSVSGIRAFLRYAETLLAAPQAETTPRANPRALWLTPQGEIVSAWRRPIRFQAGVGALVRRVRRVAVVPVGIAYEFLDEPRPEIFVKLGAPRMFDGADDDARTIARLLERDLERELDALLAAVLARDMRPFRARIEGRAAISAVYDPVRRVRARLTGRRDPARHGDVISDPRKARRP
jgi:1-acyl-sn-glycerol-3-phosphate acyltransferase